MAPSSRFDKVTVFKRIACHTELDVYYASIDILRLPIELLLCLIVRNYSPEREETSFEYSSLIIMKGQQIRGMGATRKYFLHLIDI